MEWVNAFVGLPYREHGRDRSGLDCWGLYRLAFAVRTEFWLPSWDTVTRADAQAAIAGEAVGTDWTKVDEPKETDLVVMRGVFRDASNRLCRGDVHCGMFISGGRVLHIEQNTNSVCVPLRDLARRGPTIWRHRSAA